MNKDLTEEEKAQIVDQFNLDADEYGRDGPWIGPAMVGGVFVLLTATVTAYGLHLLIS